MLRSAAAREKRAQLENAVLTAMRIDSFNQMSARTAAAYKAVLAQSELTAIAKELYSEDSAEFMQELVKEFALYQDYCRIRKFLCQDAIALEKLLGEMWTVFVGMSKLLPLMK